MTESSSKNDGFKLPICRQAFHDVLESQIAKLSTDNLENIATVIVLKKILEEVYITTTNDYFNTKESLECLLGEYQIISNSISFNHKWLKEKLLENDELNIHFLDRFWSIGNFENDTFKTIEEFVEALNVELVIENIKESWQISSSKTLLEKWLFEHKPDIRFLDYIKNDEDDIEGQEVDLVGTILELESKYSKLVWYARKAPAKNVSYWEDTQDEIKKTFLDLMKEVEDKYPIETTELKDTDRGDFNHGFNSGCLAAFRFLLTSLDESEGISSAISSFPDLET